MRTFLKISSVPTEKEIYGILIKYEPQQFTDFVFELLNELCPKRKSGSKGIVIDSTDINLNLNWHAKKISKENSMEDLHRYKRSSVQKYCSLAVLLVGMTVNYGIRERKELQAFSE